MKLSFQETLLLFCRFEIQIYCSVQFAQVSHNVCKRFPGGLEGLLLRVPSGLGLTHRLNCHPSSNNSDRNRKKRQGEQSDVQGIT